MALGDLFDKKVNIGGHEVPVMVIVLGVGAVVIFIITRGGSSQTPSSNPIAAAQNANDLANQIASQTAGGGGGASSGADVASLLSQYMTGFGSQFSDALAKQNQQTLAEINALKDSISKNQPGPVSGNSLTSMPAPEQTVGTAYRPVTTNYSIASPVPSSPPISKALPAPTPAPVAQTKSYTYASTVAARGASGSYVVKSGDTLSGIARSQGISLSSLIGANPQIANPNLIYPGQQVYLP